MSQFERRRMTAVADVDSQMSGGKMRRPPVPPVDGWRQEVTYLQTSGVSPLRGQSETKSEGAKRMKITYFFL